MKKSLCRATVPIFLLGLLAACGGKDPGTKVTPAVVDAAGNPAPLVAVAYQVESDAWRVLSPDADGKLSFYVPKGKTRYGVAVRCTGTTPVVSSLMNDSVNVVVQLTTEESTAPRLTCLTPGPLASLTGRADVSGVTGAAKFMVFSGRDGWYSRSTASGYYLTAPYGTGRDVVVLAADTSRKGLAGKLVRGISALNSVSLPDITLTNADALVNHNVAAFAVPPGWSGKYSLSLYTAGGTTVRNQGLGAGSHAGGSIRAFANTQAGDIYMLGIYASSSTNDRGTMRLRFIDAPDLGDISESLQIDPFAPRTVAAAARPALPANHADEGVLAYMFVTTSTGNFWMYTVSRPWLAGAEAYAVPDLGGLYGFGHTQPLSGETMDWYAMALKANISPQKLFELPRAIDYYFAFPREKGAVLDIALLQGSFVVP